MTDFYKLKLKHAAWTWNEGKFSRFHSRPERKDRIMSRHDKRAARNDERREMERDGDLSRV